MGKSTTKTVVAIPTTEYPLAEGYERVHYIGHAMYDPLITKEAVTGHADEIKRGLEAEIGYQVFIRAIEIKHFPPFTTDVDFVIDTPYTPESPIAAATVIAFLKVLTLVLLVVTGLLFIVWLWWTTWVQKDRIYYCDQDDPPGAFVGEQAYRAHLAVAHPEKSAAYEQSQAWWEKIPWETILAAIPWIIGGAIIIEILRFARGS